MKKTIKILLLLTIVTVGFWGVMHSQKSVETKSAEPEEMEKSDDEEKVSQDYEGIQYDEEGFIMSPDELNADLPESTYEEIEADGAYEEAMDAEQEEENEIHFDDGTATDISDSVTIESYPEYSSDISSDSDLPGENPASFFMSGE